LKSFFYYKRERERESEFTPKSGGKTLPRKTGVPPVKAFFTLIGINIQKLGENVNGQKSVFPGLAHEWIYWIILSPLIIPP
jgi:hypothetical protein